jgi:Domain of unknown function (DUF1906)/Putative peptidoglycan binding domain
MSASGPRRSCRLASAAICAMAVASALVVALLPAAFVSATADVSRSDLGRVVSIHGFHLQVPDRWQVVDLASHPHACLRFDRPAVFLGAAGDQAECPARVIGGAPGVQVQALTPAALKAFAGPLLSPPGSSRLDSVRLPSSGPVEVAVPVAGLLLTLMYGPHDAYAMRGVLAGSGLDAGARVHEVGTLRQVDDPHPPGVSVPGDFHGLGFDTCAAPSQAVMNAWRASSGYASLGIYIGGVDLGCAQPNLTSDWVSRQVALGWHLLPIYVGHQAPCSNLMNRFSYDVPSARRQGQADAADAMAMAAKRGIAAPSTVYSDMEGYDSSNERCVAAVMSYLSGWTFAMHTKAYQAGVYSSASSGIHDLSVHYDSLGANLPDDLFMAWWNHQMDVRYGRYVPVSQWRSQQRVHQYEGQATETYGGHSLLVDRNFIDVSSVVQKPEGCPTSLDFEDYPLLRWPAHGEEVHAAQCLLAMRGFDPGPATGVLNWRTAAAIRAFKASRALDSVTSSLGSAAWTALLSAGTIQPLHLGSTGPWVRKVQRTLTARLQATVMIDGVFGTTTQDAVRLYQSTVGLKPTGMVGRPTWRELQGGR